MNVDCPKPPSEYEKWSEEQIIEQIALLYRILNKKREEREEDGNNKR